MRRRWNSGKFRISPFPTSLTTDVLIRKLAYRGAIHPLHRHIENIPQLGAVDDECRRIADRNMTGSSSAGSARHGSMYVCGSGLLHPNDAQLISICKRLALCRRFDVPAARGQEVLPSFITSHRAWRPVARHRRKPVIRRGLRRRLCAFGRFAELCTRVGVACQMKVWRQARRRAYGSDLLRTRCDGSSSHRARRRAGNCT
jgi:hypothetical protein